MTKITQIDDRSATVAWSPVREYADVIALGIKDSGGIGFEETGAELELYDLNLSQSGGSQPMLLGSVKTQSRFSSLGWSAPDPAGRYPLGVLAGGMENGTVHVWDANAVMRQEPQALIASFNHHSSGPIKALQFNPHNPNQLATGGSDGMVLIHNLEQPDAAPFTPCANNSSQQKTQITALAWNTQVAHIVASAAADGTVAVWDLNSRKAWCELRAETSGLAVADLAWNPTQGLHLLTASADDRNPVIKLWDLRASTSMPLGTLAGHQQGILSMAWCPHDDHLLLSSGKDNRTILWDLYYMKAIAEVPNDAQQPQPESIGNEMFGAGGLASNQQRRYDIQWSPIKRGVASTCSLDRKVQAHSILGLSSKSGRPPKWMRPASSVSCGFGGSMVSCGSTDKIVRIQQFVEMPELERMSREFESTIESMNVIDYCVARASKANNPGEQHLWAFMQVIFEVNARQQLLDTLGYDPNVIASHAAAYTEDPAAQGVASMSLEDKNTTFMSKETQDVVKKALLVGNFEAAVECCFRTGNLADGLVLASCGGGDLWAKTQERYFQSQSAKRPFLSTVSAIIRNELEEMVQKSEPQKWQETLAILSTYGKSEEFPKLCISLGDLLENAGDSRNASLCYMCALNLDKAVQFWKSELESANKAFGGMDFSALHEFVVKVSVFMKAVGSSAQLGSEESELFAKYAAKLSEQGLLVTAAKYSKGDSMESKILRDRLYRCKASPNCLAAMGNVAPEFPFTLSDPKKSKPKPVASSQHSQQRKAYATQESYQSATSASSYSMALNSQSGHQNGYSAPQGGLPAGWVEVQDPSSGRMYYANQTTGEVTWDKPQAAPVAAVAAPSPQPETVAAQPAATPNRTTKMASKYGDGFVTSASHPELGSQYGNVGTSNPYHGTARPGTAQVAGSQTPAKPPVSNDLDLDKIAELREEYIPIKDCLPSLIEALKNTQLTAVEKKALVEAEKGVAVLLKGLTRGFVSDDIGGKVLTMCAYINSYDFRSAQSVQTGLVNSDWKEHKNWLKGTKALLQLAAKKFAQ